MRITGATRVAGVVGSPVRHSLSPLIHNAWIEAAGLDAVYAPFVVEPGRFASFVDGLRAGSIVGLNVTLPFKSAAADLADVASDAVQTSGAANVLRFLESGAVSADNTDGAGLLSALRAGAPHWRAAAGPAVILGAGGAARGALAALRAAGAPHVRVVARRANAARDLADSWGDQASGYDLRQLSRALDGATVVVNATSAGLNGEGALPPLDGAPDDLLVMDIVYRPLDTPFLQDARRRGLKTVDGLAMLIGQARPSFEAFFGVAAPPEVDVRGLCLATLGRPV